MKNGLVPCLIWSEEAVLEVKKAPGFVQPLIRTKAEKYAAEKGITTITSELLSELRSSYNVVGNKTAAAGNEGIEQFYADVGDSSLYTGFKGKPNIHPGSSGRLLDGNEAYAVSGTLLNNIAADEKAVAYIHIPFCMKNCDFCAFYRNRTDCKDMDIYISALVKEIEITGRKLIESKVLLNAVYIGGGTPTDLSAGSLDKLLSAVNKWYPLSNDCEITVEGRLYGFRDNKIDICLKNGVSRFSFGVQSFNTVLRRSVGRIQSKDDLLDRLSYITSLNQASVAVDLIYGLPGQSLEEWQTELTTLTNETDVDGCSIYQLNLFPGTPITEKIEDSRLPSPADFREQADLFLFSNKYLKNIPAARASIRHWKLSSRERSLYNIYSKYGYTCIPAGCGAGGNVGRYSVMQGMDLESYYTLIEKGEKPFGYISEKDADYRLFGNITGSFEEYLGINMRKLGEIYGVRVLDIFEPLFHQWETAGMIVRDNFENVSLTGAGEFWNVNIVQNIIDYYKWKRQNG